MESHHAAQSESDEQIQNIQLDMLNETYPKTTTYIEEFECSHPISN